LSFILLLRVSRRSIGFALHRPVLALQLASGRVSYEHVLRSLVEGDIKTLRSRAGRHLQPSSFLKLSEREMTETLAKVTPAKQEGSWRMLNRWHSFLYIVVRASSPSIVVETGVLYGHSSAAILAALEDNGKGRLISVDLPIDLHQNIKVGKHDVQ